MRRVNTCPEFKIIKKSSSIENNLNIIFENSENSENSENYEDSENSKKNIEIDTYCELSEFGGKVIKYVRLKVYKDQIMDVIFPDENICTIAIERLKILFSIDEAFIIFTLKNKELNDNAPTFELNFSNYNYLHYLNFLKYLKCI